MDRKDSELLKKLGKEIRLRRTALDWSQEKLADEAGITFKHVSKIELGLSKPSVITLNHIAVALKTSPNDLLGFGASDKDSLDPKILFERLLLLIKGRPKLQMEFLKRLFDETGKVFK